MQFEFFWNPLNEVPKLLLKPKALKTERSLKEAEASTRKVSRQNINTEGTKTRRAILVTDNISPVATNPTQE